MRYILAMLFAALISPFVASTSALAGTMSLKDFVNSLGPSSAASSVQVRLAWDPKPNGSGQQYTYSDPRAGEFIVEIKNGTSWDRIAYDADGNGSLESIYKTFCVEMGEHIDPVNQPGDPNYWTAYATLDDNALFGKNVSPGPLGDPLSPETEVLYGLYHQGLLGTLVPGFTYQDKDWATGLQQAVWALEDNLTGVS